MPKVGSVKRPKIRSTSITPRGSTITKKIPLISPFNGTPSYLQTKVAEDSNVPICTSQPPADLYIEQLLGDETEKVCPWAQVRMALKQVHLGVPSIAACFECAKEMACDFVRCEDCGPFAYYCQQCCQTTHGAGGTIHQQLLFHKPQLWTATGYIDFHLDIRLDRPDHDCPTKQIRSGLQVFDDKGRIHDCSLVHCQCETDECVTLMHHNLWSASTQQPKVAFHMELMNWLEFLILESALSLQAACLAIRWKNSFTDSEYNTLYKHLVGEPIEEFLFFKNMCREAGEEANECPACPTESGNLFISFDGNFGLVRKQNGGKSVFGPRHGTRIFAPQDEVDDFVDKNQSKIPQSKNCNSFRAGSVVRAQNKTVKLAQKGVFGAACRHGVPRLMMSIRQGERLAYSVYALNSLLDQVKGTDVKLHVLYDIACLLDKYIQGKENADKYKDIPLAVPIFHAYGHKLSCQVQYSCRWLDSFALTDGEVLERLWSFLRPFSNSTKEMTPSHRVDRLTSALLHYSRKKIHEMDALMYRNMDKAAFLVKCCTEELNGMKTSKNITDNQIQELVRLEKERARVDSNTRGPHVRRGESVKQELLSKLHAQAVEYTFVLTLQRKYSRGQAIAKRIGRNRNKICKRMKELLSLYNEEVEEEEELEFKQVCQPEAPIYNNLDHSLQDSSPIGAEDRRKAIDLYIHRLRANEELVQTKEEMRNCLKWYALQCSNVQNKIKKSSTRGDTNTFKIKETHLKKAYIRAQRLFSKFIPVPQCSQTDDFPDIVLEEDILEEEELGEDMEYEDLDIDTTQ